MASADPYATEVSPERALVARVGYGSGDEVADGRFGEARELPAHGARRARRSMEAPEERFAALLGGREEVLPAEELVLRARADLNAGRLAEAALQARVAIEALLAARLASRGRPAPAGGSLGGAPRGDRGGRERGACARSCRETARRRWRRPWRLWNWR